ncbi:MAG: IS1380 family transposase [Anaerolineae bacterium]
MKQRRGWKEDQCGRLHSRNQKFITHPQVELIRTIVILLSQGWQDRDDADRLRNDPTFRLAVSERRGAEPLHSPEEPGDHPDGLASQPTLSRLITDLSPSGQRHVLREAIFQCAVRRLKATRGHRLRYATLDMDSFPLEAHGHQEGVEYNGYYRQKMYHPIIANVAETGDLLDLQLRPGAVHTAAGCRDFLLPLLDRMEREYCQVASVRFDAGFPGEDLFSALEARDTAYVCRLKKNNVLETLAEPYLSRPPGRPPLEPRTWLHELRYQAEDWSAERRLVLVVQEIPDELFPRHFFLLTNWNEETMPAEDLLWFYRQRGTAEGYIGEIAGVLAPTLSSTCRPKSHYQGRPVHRHYPSVDPFGNNEVYLLLNGLAYNLVHAVRCLIETATHQGFSLRRLVEYVLKAPARIILRSRNVTVVISSIYAEIWQKLCRKLATFSVLNVPDTG